MRKWIVSLVLGILLAVGFVATTGLEVTPTAIAQEIDTEVPPGNPVIGSDRAGDIEAAGETNYALWSLFAVCLIGAGILLVTIERWEARRIEHAERPSKV